MVFVHSINMELIDGVEQMCFALSRVVVGFCNGSQPGNSVKKTFRIVHPSRIRKSECCQHPETSGMIDVFDERQVPFSLKSH